MGRIVGIDFGTVRLGIAISDETKTIARTLLTLSASKKSEETADALLKKIQEFKVEALVIGMPFHMNGRIGFLGDEVMHFAELLKMKSGLPVVFWDERLTTVQAERSLREAQLSRKKRAKVIDSVTAVIMLQSYLDRQKGCAHE